MTTVDFWPKTLLFRTQQGFQAKSEYSLIWSTDVQRAKCLKNGNSYVYFNILEKLYFYISSRSVGILFLLTNMTETFKTFQTRPRNSIPNLTFSQIFQPFCSLLSQLRIKWVSLKRSVILDLTAAKFLPISDFPKPNNCD